MKNIKNIFSCKNIDKFLNTIQYQLNVDAHVSMNYFYVCEYEGVQFLTKLVFHKKSTVEIYGPPTTKMSQQEAEIKILEVLKEFHDKTPCILEMIYYITCPADGKILNDKLCSSIDVRSIPSNTANNFYYNVCYFNDLVKNGLADNKITFMILEQCDMSFSKFLNSSADISVNIEIVRSVLFQIIYTLYIIHKKYPLFIHYDLHSSNILLKVDHEYTFSEYEYIEYVIGGVSHYVPYFGFIPVMIDFGHSSLPEHNIINCITDDKYVQMARPKSDILLFMYSIYQHSKYYHELLKEIDVDLFKNLSIGKLSCPLSNPLSSKEPAAIELERRLLKSAAFNVYKNKQKNVKVSFTD